MCANNSDDTPTVDSSDVEDEDETHIRKWRYGIRAGQFVTWDDPGQVEPPPA